MSLPKLLWISDACVPTGFARVTHNILGWLGARWDRVVVGVNATGRPHEYPYRVWPAACGGDRWGFGLFPEVVKAERPDIIVIQSDSWIVESFVAEIAEAVDSETGEQIVPNCPPIVGYIPIDARGMKRGIAKNLSRLALTVFYTEFGRQEAISCGHTGPTTAIGLGVRRDIYKPVPKAEARRKLLPSIPPGAFVVGNVNRNQPRKRLDLTIAYFAEWLKRGGDGYLYLHCLEKDSGYDLRELADWYGIGDRFAMPTAKDYTELLPEHFMPTVYSALDVQVSTSVGEGWGLCTLEGMACGTPQILPEFAALGEWPRGAVYYVPATPGEASMGVRAFGIGSTPQQEPFIAALDRLYRNPSERRALSEAGLALVSEKRFEWSDVAMRFDQELSAVLARSTQAAA